MRFPDSAQRASRQQALDIPVDFGFDEDDV